MERRRLGLLHPVTRAVRHERDGEGGQTRLVNVGLAALCRGGWLDRAESILVDAIRLGLPPDVVTYNTLLAAHCRVAGFDAGIAVVHRMREAGVRPDSITYNSLITDSDPSGLTVRALDLFDEMLRSGLAPDAWSYNALMHYLFRSGHPEHAYWVEILEKGIVMIWYILRQTIRSTSKGVFSIAT